MQAPRVFVSYAQFALEHSARVLELASALRQHGIDADLDQFHQHELLDWPRWCLERLRSENTDWVLMICSAAYRDRLENRVDLHTGKGVFWEGALIDDELYAAKGNRRFVPVLLDDEPEESIPAIVRGWTWFRIRGLDLAAPGFADLYRLLTGQPKVAPPLLGLSAYLEQRSIATRLSTISSSKPDRVSEQMRGIRNRAAKLLLSFFADDDPRTRRVIFNQAFSDCERDPRSAITYTDSVELFADHIVETLLKHGCAGKGRHSLSLLIEAMANARGRQNDPDFAELPQLLDEECALPTREEELRHLRALIEREEALAALYSPLCGLAQSQPGQPVATLLKAWRNHKDIALLLHQRRCEPLDRGQRALAASCSRNYDDILSAFADVKQAALLGAPGAGKSTTLRKLAVDMARTALEDPTAPIPLFVSLGFWRSEEDLSTFLAEQQPELGWAATALARRDRLVLLLDGLNEVPAAQRKTKAVCISTYRSNLPGETPLIVSCRRDDYVGELDLDLDKLSLEPLTPQRVRAILQHWLSGGAGHLAPASADQLFWQLAGDARLADVLQTWRYAGADEDTFWSLADPEKHAEVYAETSDEEDTLWRRHVPNPRSLLRLAANPFMLTMLYVTWLQNQGTLPKNRGDLFAKFTDILLSREGLIETGDGGCIARRDTRADQLLEGLASIAMAMQDARRVRADADYGEQHDLDDAGVLTIIPRVEALRLLADESLLKIAEDATLLEGGEEIRFRHQLLQEHFTALSLQKLFAADALEAQRLWPAERWWERSGWEEAVVLLAGFASDDCTPVVHWLKEAQPEVAAQCILESGAGLANREALLRELRDAWLPRLTDAEREPEPEGRAAIGRALGRLGLDDRPGVGLTVEGLPDIDWVEIAGGDFLYQDGDRRTCDPFQVSRYPITHAQFQAFVDADDGYASRHWWPESIIARDMRQAMWPISNHPRETITWQEAMAFCSWLSDRLQLTIELPTEWEWERVACGESGQLYPWGDTYLSGYANIDERLGNAGAHAILRTVAVGIYPHGLSPEGVLDLAGNVWEWCSNTFVNQPYYRVLRGGSWMEDQDDCHGQFREESHVNDGGPTVGFRVVMRSGP